MFTNHVKQLKKNGKITLTRKDPGYREEIVSKLKNFFNKHKNNKKGLPKMHNKNWFVNKVVKMNSSPVAKKASPKKASPVTKKVSPIKKTSPKKVSPSKKTSSAKKTSPSKKTSPAKTASPAKNYTKGYIPPLCYHARSPEQIKYYSGPGSVYNMALKMKQKKNALKNFINTQVNELKKNNISIIKK